ncbi:hypothetical protein SLEP1_g18186 [Rubroshorea leprosula]|uniref:Uncharacterized protein n=1 Tax=Rubroshorea leprosula TaxID=152421 RepID=A0AAV5IWR5_9ROSI|nr:hypothetical protein SLEP1_g18186 [Rubroshorea leprosula]
MAANSYSFPSSSATLLFSRTQIKFYICVLLQNLIWVLQPSCSILLQKSDLGSIIEPDLGFATQMQNPDRSKEEKEEEGEERERKSKNQGWVKRKVVLGEKESCWVNERNEDKWRETETNPILLFFFPVSPAAEEDPGPRHTSLKKTGEKAWISPSLLALKHM